jgi:hypothetical protein
MTFTHQSEAAAVTKKPLVNKDRFMKVQQQCGVPTPRLMPAFEREFTSLSPLHKIGALCAQSLNRLSDWPRFAGDIDNKCVHGAGQ